MVAPREWHERAMAAERGGAAQEAERIIAQGLAEHPREAELHNSAGNIALRRGDFEAAANRFAEAARRAPGNLSFAINHAIALDQAGRHRAAFAVLQPREAEGRRDARYCSLRGTLARSLGDLAQSARWYDACLALAPDHQRGLAGRARVALERCEAETIARYDQALARLPGDADLWLGKANALDMHGQVGEAFAIMEQVVGQAPAWTPGLDFLAQLRLARGDSDFADHYPAAARRVPQDPNIPAAHIAALAGVERYAEACEAAHEAQIRFAHIEHFVLLEAAFASAAGDDTRADVAFARLATDTLDRALHEARHAIRQRDWAAADAALERAIGFSGENVAAWALRGIVWRASGDARARWLHEQAGLVRLLALDDGEAVLPPAIARLHKLHETASFPHGQSLRGGTQTRGNLFQREEPELVALREAILRTLETYRDGLPPADPHHPLLRHRDAAWRMRGSWSVRLSAGGDHHASHIHPQGLLSSALYLVLPRDDNAGPEGLLELGRPPPDLRLDLEPLAVLTPKPGHLALFPSTLYHGTTPFSSGLRMTSAFDVIAERDDE